ncbi:hypothetical protein D4R20_01920 [bacterium]|nr:MAG: hypothetical protein D4R20_01920 [bacterium]
MKKNTLFLFVLTLLILIGFRQNSYAQNTPVLYFCETYDANGETGISDRFTVGIITVMVKADNPLGLTNVTIQADKYDWMSNKFSYSFKKAFDISADMKYIYFSSKDLNFKEPGIYRVFLLDSDARTITSSLLEIIPK